MQFAIAVGFLFVLQFFFMPETTFVRSQIVPTSAPGSSTDSRQDDKPTAGDRREVDEKGEAHMIPARGYAAGLKPWSGVYKTKSNPLTLLARPMMMLFTPIVFVRLSVRLVIGAPLTLHSSGVDFFTEWCGWEACDALRSKRLLVPVQAITYLVVLAVSISVIFSFPPYK